MNRPNIRNRNKQDRIRRRNFVPFGVVLSAMALLAGAPFCSGDARAQNFQQGSDQDARSNNRDQQVRTAPSYNRDQQVKTAPSYKKSADDIPVGRITVTAPLVGGVSRLDALNDKNGLDGGAGRSNLEGMIDQTGRLERLRGVAETMIKTPPMTGKAHAESIEPARFRGWLEKSHPTFALKCESNPPAEVVVVKGEWDNSSKTLDKMRIAHSKIVSADIPRYNFTNTKVIIVDCSGEMNRASCQILRNFVARGGYILSTDWALDHFLSNSFNEYVRWNRKVNRRKIYDATVFDADEVLFGHTVSNAHWKLDKDTHLVQIINKDAVHVLVTSSQLKNEDPDGQGVLALLFPFGRGFVLHMTGHFDNDPVAMFAGNKLPDPAPVIGISLRQALAANFVVAGVTGERIPTRNARF